MLKRALYATVFVVSSAMAVSATVVGAASLTDLIDSSRMTIVKTDLVAGRFFCAEHRRWAPAVKAALRTLQAGDVVRVDRQPSGPAHLVLLRTAADELSSPER